MTYSRGSRASAPIERCVLRLQPYNYKVCCVKSQDNIADTLSRLTKIPASEKYRYDDERIRISALIAVSIALRIHEIESASAGDGDLQAVRSCLGNWEKAPKRDFFFFQFFFIRTHKQLQYITFTIHYR